MFWLFINSSHSATPWARCVGVDLASLTGHAQASPPEDGHQMPAPAPAQHGIANEYLLAIGRREAVYAAAERAGHADLPHGLSAPGLFDEGSPRSLPYPRNVSARRSLSSDAPSVARAVPGGVNPPHYGLAASPFIASPVRSCAPRVPVAELSTTANQGKIFM